jgi:hypothetical protein
MDLQALLPLLQSHRVTRFEGYGIKLELDGSSAPARMNDTLAVGLSSSAPNDAASGKIPNSPDSTMDLPGTNEVMSADTILNWSAPAGQDSLPMPLTGEDEHG